MYRVSVGYEYYAVPAAAVTLNGLYLPKLNTADAAYTGRVCLLLRDGRAAMGEDGRRAYVYADLAEAMADAAVLAATDAAPQRPAATDAKCQHDARFGGVLGAKNGCLACQLEQTVVQVDELTGQVAALIQQRDTWMTTCRSLYGTLAASLHLLADTAPDKMARKQGSDL